MYQMYDRCVVRVAWSMCVGETKMKVCVCVSTKQWVTLHNLLPTVWLVCKVCVGGKKDEGTIMLATVCFVGFHGVCVCVCVCVCW